MRRLLSALVIWVIAAGAAAGSHDVARPDGPVGATQRRFVPQGAYNWRGAATHALITTIWYPAVDASMSDHTIGPPASPLFRLGQWADDAKPAAGPFPLVVLSHGTGGSAQIMAWLARSLAAHGYVVAAVNHPGNNALEEYTAEGFLAWWERARDLTTVIDLLLADPQFGNLIDRRRIGAAGFSLGGYTMFEIAGARTDPARWEKYCHSAEAVGCDDPPEFPNLREKRAELMESSSGFRTATSHAGDSYRDGRIRAVFAIAPALGQTFIPDSVRRIAIPVEIVAGADDRFVPVGPNAQLLAKLTPHATLKLLPGGVGHYTFLAACTDSGRRVRPDLCTDAASVDRQAVHERTTDLARKFFDRTLQ